MSASEIARIREQIDLEYTAARRGLEGMAQGSSLHQFITARMERISQLHQELGTIVGETQALEIVSEAMGGKPSNPGKAITRV